ncbi:conjugative transfer relaxase/helicase TraI [Vibrio cortegadensis]|uniref:conjugative transfer relaxase/helicase TraI n=1 Tax=Vibrio cortegadensis TaxID=1328770 RepID=UPI00352C623C
MLSITPLKSAGNATKYYLNEEKDKNLPDVTLEKTNDNYYLKEQSQTQNTQWLGSIARASGMEGKPVDEPTLEKALLGEWGDETIHGRREKHRPGFDLTFSAPKSASVLALIGGDERLISFHDQSVAFALSELEKDTAQVKTTDKNGKQHFENTQAMLFAVVRHKTSREDDPQLHSHALASNMTRDQEGKLRALASCLKQSGGVVNGTSERIYHHQKYYTALYQSQYAKLAETAGYSIEGVGNGQFEISGVPKEVSEHFSKRSQQIAQKTLDLGFDTQATRDLAAKNTRKEKSYSSESSLNQTWQQEIKTTGFDAQNFVEQAKEGTLPPPKNIDVNMGSQEAIQRALSHLGQTKTAFSLENLVEKAAAEFTKGGRGNAIDIKAVADQMIARGELITLDKKGLYTTQSLIETENQLLDISKGRAAHMKVTVNDRALSNLNLSQSNSKKVAELFESTKQFNVVNVFGSTEQIAKNLLHVGTQSNRRIHLISATSQEQNINQDKVFKQSHNAREWIKNAFIQDHRHTLTSFLNNASPSLTNQDVLLVDSANKLSAKELMSLTEKAKESNSKVIYLNRASARQGFKAHSAMDLYSKGNVLSHQWVNDKKTDSRIYLHNQDHAQLAQSYANLPDKSRTQVLSMTQKEGDKLTHVIRDTLKNDGQLSRVGVHVDTQNAKFLTDAQKDVVTHYTSGMTLRAWSDGKPKEWLVANTHRASNTLNLLSKETGEQTQIDPSSKAFKSLNVQLFTPERLELCQGDQLLSTGKHVQSGLKNQHAYTVKGTDNERITLEESNGKSITIDRAHLKDAPLRYHYVKSSHHINPDQSHIMLTGKNYGLSKELITELQANSDRVDIFTDNTEKAQQSMMEHEHRPSAIHRVLNHTQTNEHYVSSSTAMTLKNDISQILNETFTQKEAPLIEKAVNFALGHISEREAGFTQKQLVQEAVRYAFEEAGLAVTKEEVVQQLNDKSHLLSAEFHDGSRWTTQEAIETERHILDNLTQGKGAASPYSSIEEVNDYLSQHERMTHGQKEAITLVSTTPDRFVGVQGLAGTGKSTMLESNVEVITQSVQCSKNQPDHIIGLAPTHAAVSELKNKGIEAQTLESLLTDIRNGSKSADQYHNSLFLLDESSMVGNQQTKEFTDLVINSQSKAVLLGDKEQLLSLSAGKPFELAVNNGAMKVAYMTDIVRQQEEHLLGAVHNIVDKQPESTLDKLKQQPTQPQGINKSEHVISTLDETNKNKTLAQAQATVELPYAVAQDYLSRTQESRENTLIIAYTNNERDDITHQIRPELIKRKELGKENIQTLRMRQVNTSKEELATMLPYQKGLIISTKPGHYGIIDAVDKNHGVVLIKDEENGDISTFLPKNRNHKFTGLFSTSTQPLSTGDKIITRFNDKERGIKANQVFWVNQATKDGIQATDNQGKTIDLNPNTIKDGHWDYGYTRTADMAQGATYQHVITAIKGKGQLTDIRRAYIDVSRASEHVRLYTDNPQAMMKNWINKDSNKSSALETAATQAPKETLYFNDQPLPKENPRYQDINGDFDKKRFSDHIHTTLPKYTESLSEQLLGQSNKSQSNKDFLVFGSGKDVTKISLTGEYRGYFVNNVTGEKGGLLNLLMSTQGINYRDALTEADKLIHSPEKYELEENPHHDKLKSSTPKHIAKFETRAKDYYEQAIPVSGTLGERYLQTFINESSNLSSDNIKYHSSVYSSETKSVHPAILMNIHDKNGETKAVEITYLNGQGEQADVDINKRTMGNKSGNFTVLNHGDDLNTTIITTSLEEGLTAQKITNSEFDIITTTNHHDIQKISNDELRQHVIIAVDGKIEDVPAATINKIVESLKQSTVHLTSIEELTACIDKEVKLNDHYNNDFISNKLNPPIENDTKNLTTDQTHNDTYLNYNAKTNEPKQSELDFNNERERDREIER